MNFEVIMLLSSILCSLATLGTMILGFVKFTKLMQQNTNNDIISDVNAAISTCKSSRQLETNEKFNDIQKKLGLMELKEMSDFKEVKKVVENLEKNMNEKFENVKDQITEIKNMLKDIAKLK